MLQDIECQFERGNTMSACTCRLEIVCSISTEWTAVYNISHGSTGRYTTGKSLLPESQTPFCPNAGNTTLGKVKK